MRGLTGPGLTPSSRYEQEEIPAKSITDRAPVDLEHHRLAGICGGLMINMSGDGHFGRAGLPQSLQPVRGHGDIDAPAVAELELHRRRMLAQPRRGDAVHRADARRRACRIVHRPRGGRRRRRRRRSPGRFAGGNKAVWMTGFCDPAKREGAGKRRHARPGEGLEPPHRRPAPRAPRIRRCDYRRRRLRCNAARNDSGRPGRRTRNDNKRTRHVRSSLSCGAGPGTENCPFSRWLSR